MTPRISASELASEPDIRMASGVASLRSYSPKIEPPDKYQMRTGAWLWRLRQLAGLTESIASDPQVNTEIEARLGGDSTADKDIWLDMLDIVLRSKLVSPSRLMADIVSLYPETDRKQITKMIRQLPDKFDNVVAVQQGWFVWRSAKQNDTIQPPNRADRWRT